MGKITVYAPDSMDWTGNGQAILDPISCEITEEAGGEYELEMVHPCDKWNKWKYLVNEAIIKVPVPQQTIPSITGQSAYYWRVKTTVTADVIVYAKPLIYTYDSASSYSAWSASTVYHKGDYVSMTTVSGTKGYRYVGPDGYLTEAPGTTSVWQELSQYDSSRPGTWTGGGKVAQIYAGDRLIKLGSYNSDWLWVKLEGTSITGYVKSTYCQSTSTRVPSQPPRSITEQCFRVYSVTVDSEDNNITVNARHISFDFRQIAVGACEVDHATPSTAIALLQASTLVEDVRTITTDMDEPLVTGDYSWNNAIYALMDEEVGLVAQLKAKLIRDNNDFFILKNNKKDSGFTIEYGNNLIGVTWTIDVDDVVTRLVPRGETQNGGLLLLPERYIDSSIIDDYAVVRMDNYDSGYKVGDEYTDEYHTTWTLTENDCYVLMRKDCDTQFNRNRIDEPTFSLDVEFLMLGDTVEYSHYKNLQMLALYDMVQIKHSPLGFVKKMQMKGYTWDCVNERYISTHFDGYYDAVVRTETVTRPERAMTSNQQDFCVVSASSRKTGSNPVYKAFDYLTSDGWIPNPSETNPWIQIRLDKALTHIKVWVYARDSSTFSHPKSGYVQGSNDGENWTTLETFSGWEQNTGGMAGFVICNNTQAYAFVRLVTTEFSAITDDMSIGYIYVVGEATYNN